MALAGGDSAALEPWISVNQPGRIFIARLGRSELTDIMTAVPVRELVELMLESSGRGVEPSEPFVNIRLPGGVSVADV